MIRRQVRAVVSMLSEKETEESKIIPRLRTVAERGNGIRGGASLGRCSNRNSVLVLLIKSLREASQADIAVRISERKELEESKQGK